MTEYPRGRPPKCYRKAYRYVECDACMWLNYCKPKPVPIQQVAHWDTVIASEVPPSREDGHT